MKRFIKPDFGRCNLNISATLAEFLGAPNKNKTLPILKKELAKNYKNIVFICFDGLGINPININLNKNDILRKNIVKKLVSTFPSTTTNATTSLATNLLPLEHGWLGWSLYFEEIGRNIDIYLGKDSESGEKVDFDLPLESNINYYFDNAHTDYEINTIFMPYCRVVHPERNTYIQSEEDLVKAIRAIIKKPGKQFVYAYYDQPDAVMHINGVSSDQAKQKIESINAQIQKLYDECADTLFVITADHGQIDVTGYVEFYKDKELNDMLECCPYLDSRSPCFRVKQGYEEQFAKIFKKRYGKDYALFKSADLIKKGYFGSRGNKGFLLGTYIGAGRYNNKQFLSFEGKTRFKGHHTSLTKEMEVPLILLAKK